MGVSGVMDTSNSYVKYHITINQNSQNVANNTSNVSVYVNFWRTNTGYSTYGSGTVYCKINGTTYSASVSPSQKITSSGIDLFSKTLDIGHNSDGTKTLATSAWISIDAPLSSSEQSYSQTLTTIPRASSISSISGGTLGSSVTVNISRASSSFTHTVKYQRSDGTQFTVGTGQTTSCTFTPSINDSNYLPNATSGTAKIYVDTYSGGTFIGSTSSNFTVYVPSSIIPTISSVTLSETVAGITAKFGGYVQGKSKIQGVVSASGAYSSTISAYTSTTNSQTLTTSTFTTNELVNSGSQSVSTIVRDSRGRNSSTTTTNYTVLAYANPAITTFTVARANSSGVLDDQGAYVLCTINASISAVNNLNDKSFKIKYKKKSDSTYTSITITPSGTTYTYNTTYLVASIDVDYEYDFRLELIDYFSTVVSDQSIPTAFTLMDFNSSGKSIAFGKVSTAGSTEKKFEVSMDIEQEEYFNGRRMQYIPNAIGDTSGWYLVLSGELPYQYQNLSFTLNVTQIHSAGNGPGTGILYANLRSQNYVCSVASFKLLSGVGLRLSDFVLKITGSNFYMYARTNSNYDTYLFEVLSESNIDVMLKTPVFTFNDPSYDDTVSEPSGAIPDDYGPQVLYSNSSGTTSTITLSETSANFSSITVVYGENSFAHSIDIYNPNGKSFYLSRISRSSGSSIEWYTEQCSVSGTSITFSRGISAYASGTTYGNTYVNNMSQKIMYVYGNR